MNTPDKITPKKLRHQKLAQAMLEGKNLRQIGEEVYPNAKNPKQTVSNCLRYEGPQAAIAEELTKLDYDKSLIREVIARRLQAIRSTNEPLHPSDARVLEIAARTEAMLTDKSIIENITSSDALVEQAEQALATLKHYTMDSVSVTDSVHDNVVSVNVQGETKATGRGKEVEATPQAVSEKE